MVSVDREVGRNRGESRDPRVHRGVVVARRAVPSHDSGGPEHPDLSRFGPQQPEDVFDQGRVAGAVCPYQPQDDTALTLVQSTPVTSSVIMLQVW